MSPQKDPTQPEFTETEAKMVRARGIEPLAKRAPNLPNIGQQPDPPAVPAAALPLPNDFRPQSSPKASRLSRRDLRDLIAICAREVGACGLDQDAGRRALELKQKLQALHAGAKS